MNLPKDDPRRKEAIDKSTLINIYLKEKGIKLLKDYFKKLKQSPLDVYKIFLDNIWQYDSSLSINEVEELQKVVDCIERIVGKISTHVCYEIYFQELWCPWTSSWYFL